MRSPGAVARCIYARLRRPAICACAGRVADLPARDPSAALCRCCCCSRRRWCGGRRTARALLRGFDSGAVRQGRAAMPGSIRRPIRVCRPSISATGTNHLRAGGLHAQSAGPWRKPRAGPRARRRRGASFAGANGEYASTARTRDDGRVRVRAGGATIGDWRIARHRRQAARHRLAARPRNAPSMTR